jgi:hypothetical protein
MRMMKEWRMKSGIEEKKKEFIEGFNEVVNLEWIK